jgi:hypothetical protein
MVDIFPFGFFLELLLDMKQKNKCALRNKLEIKPKKKRKEIMTKSRVDYLANKQNTKLGISTQVIIDRRLLFSKNTQGKIPNKHIVFEVEILILENMHGYSM